MSVSTLATSHSAHCRRPDIHTNDSVLLLLVRPVVRAVLGGGEEEVADGGTSRAMPDRADPRTVSSGERLQLSSKIQASGQRRGTFGQ